MPSPSSWAAPGPSAAVAHPSAPRWRLRWPRRAHQREWGTAAAALLLACVLFTLWPALDTTVSAWFFDGQGFVGKQSDVVMAVYWVVPWLGRAVALAGLALLLLRWWRGDVLWGWRARRVVVVACAMGLGVGALVNYALKEHSGRPRPVDTLQFGGAARFEPALSFAGTCSRNCSFVSGHAATGFVLMAWGLWGAPATRRRWWWRGLLLGAVVGAGRVMQGGHFVSDVVFAGLAMVLACLLQRALWVRWRALRRARWRAAAAAAGAAAVLPTAG